MKVLVFEPLHGLLARVTVKAYVVPTNLMEYTFAKIGEPIRGRGFHGQFKVSMIRAVFDDGLSQEGGIYDV